MKLKILPLTPILWPALEDLFGEKGACNGCWCMYWRIGNAYRKKPRETNKAAFHEVVKRGPPPGLVAFAGDLAVGWCQLTPRDDLPWLDRAWRLRRVDNVPVWSISCFYVRKGYRKQGVTCALISGHRTTRLHHEIPVLRKPSSSSSRKSPLTARCQPLVYPRIVGNPYLGIISGLLVIR